MTPRIFKSTGFRFSAVSALLLTGSLLILGALLFLYIRHSMLKELRQRIETEAAVLTQDYREGGLTKLFHDIRQRRNINKRNRLLYFFTSTKSSRTFDKVSTFPMPYGWHDDVPLDNDLNVLLYSQPLSKAHSLAIGGSLDDLERVQRLLFRILFFAVLLTLCLGSIAGLYLARRFLARLDQVNKAAERIGKGNLHERLELTGSGDDFDQLLETINKMLERIELLMKSIRRVSANVAHELRTPLGHLKQDLLTLEESGASSEEGRDIIHRAQGEIDRILEIFAALLRISELDTGEMKSRFESVNISTLLQNLYETYSPVVEEHSQTILFTDCTPEATCLGDRRLLLQLFANLIENAIRHAGSGACIQLSVIRNQNCLEVRIDDDGNGMSEETLLAAERKLYDLNPGRDADFSRGIGLMLVGAIARIHEIKIKLSPNNPGLRVDIFLALEEKH